MLKSRPILVFVGTLVVLAGLRWGMGWISIPRSFLGVANVLSGMLFLGGPLFGLIYGAKARWTFLTSFLFFLCGLLIQIPSVLLMRSMGPSPLVPVLNAVGQIGLPLWCSGLGAMIATGVKDRNILIPISIFLIGFDIFLVLTPQGFVKQQLERSPQVFTAMAGQIPAFSSQPATGHVAAGAYVGPADFVFLAMFMIALYRFDLKAKETAKLVVPVLLGYMLAVVLFGVPLPALVPIGACVLIVNRREFVLTKDEKQSTIGLLVVVVALLIGAWRWGVSRQRTLKERPVGPSKLSASPEIPAPAPTPERAETSQSRS